MALATFGTGCFWHVEETFRQLPGVLTTTAGYMGGHLPNPTYEQVCTNTTGHAEVVQLQYDPAQISYEQLLDTFWRTHDPTQVDRQGPDVGSQYRSVIFFQTPQQAHAAKQSKQARDASGEYSAPVATQILPAQIFYRAEEYHQRYIQKGGQPACAS